MFLSYPETQIFVGPHRRFIIGLDIQNHTSHTLFHHSM